MLRGISTNHKNRSERRLQISRHRYYIPADMVFSNGLAKQAHVHDNIKAVDITYCGHLALTIFVTSQTNRHDSQTCDVNS